LLAQQSEMSNLNEHAGFERFRAIQEGCSDLSLSPDLKQMTGMGVVLQEQR
jgi:hypothetical protein